MTKLVMPGTRVYLAGPEHRRIVLSIHVLGANRKERRGWPDIQRKDALRAFARS